MQTFLPDIETRKKVMRALAKSNPTWKIRRVIFVLLMIIAASIILGTVVALIFAHFDDWMWVFGLLCGSVIFSSIPYFIGLSVNNTAKYKCASPYSSYANGTLVLYDDHLEYFYWEVGMQSPAAYSSKQHTDFLDEYKITYKIYKNEIMDISTENGLICIIKGNGEIVRSEWDDYNNRPSNKVKSVSKFSFPLAFSEENLVEIIFNWRN